MTIKACPESEMHQGLMTFARRYAAINGLPRRGRPLTLNGESNHAKEELA